MMKVLLTAIALSLAAITGAHADGACVVNSPDGELNVREITSNGPGKVLGAVKNGTTVTVRDFYLLKGKSWARVLDGKTKSHVIGCVYRDYLDCDNGKTTAAVAAVPDDNQPKRRPMTTGKTFLVKCDSTRPVDENFCDGFGTAVYQVLWNMQEADQSLACIPQGTLSGALIDVAMKYIRHNKETQEYPAALAIVSAAANEWGSKCPKS